MTEVSGGRRRLRRMWSRRIGLLAIAAGTGVLTAACGGGSSTPQVASVGHHSSSGAASSASTGGGNSAAPRQGGSVTQLLDEWAACMRRHGDPGQADPTVDASKVIHIIMSPSVPGGDSGTTGQNGTGGPGTHCASLLTEAANTLGGSASSVKTPDQATLDKFSACVRANGIPDFPDLRTSANGGVVMSLGGGDLSLGNPALKNAEKLCGQKTGVHGMPGEGPPPPGTVIDDLPGGGSGVNG
jgi:hypothetical protein